MPNLRSIFSSNSEKVATVSESKPTKTNNSKGCSCGPKKTKSPTPEKTQSTTELTSSSCCSNKDDSLRSCSCGGKQFTELSCCGAKKDSEQAADNNDMLVLSSNPEHPANLICEFCRMFYNNGWVTGTGGGISVRDDDKIYLAPSGVQKERMVPTNMFVMSFKTQEYIRKPFNLKPSACTPLFMAAYTMRNAGACIHTHSQNAVLCTLLFDKVFEISSIEQIKALPKITEKGNMWYSDKLVIPIIENTEREEELETSLRKAIDEYPSATAVLVRRHGIYVWGETVWKAKIYNEAIDYLLELAIKMKQMNIPTIKQD